jgi:hypothetical protein
VPYRAGPLQNSTLTCAAASPLPPNARLQLSLSLVRLAACFSHLRTRRGAWRTDRRRDRRLLHRRGDLSLQRPGSSHVGGSSKPNPSNPELQFHRKPKPGGAPIRRTRHAGSKGGSRPEGPAAASCLRPQAASWGRPAGREEASRRREGGIREQLEATGREGGSQPRGGRNPRAVEATGSRGPARAPEHLLALKFLTAATVSSRQGA